MSRYLLLLGALSLVVAAARHAQAADKGPELDSTIFAVLPLDTKDSNLDEKATKLLEEAIRTIAGNQLVPLGYTVLTGDNTLTVLQDNGVDTSKACEASCALDTARQLKARLFVSGSISTVEGTHTAFVRLFDAGGKQLSSVSIEGAKVLDLKRSLESKANELFSPQKVPPIRKGGKQGPSGRESRQDSEETDWEMDDEQKVVVKFTTNPPASVSVDDEQICDSTPCQKPLTPGMHEIRFQKSRYETLVEQVMVQAGTVVDRKLKPNFGILSVETETPGVTVAIQQVGTRQTPVRGLELEPRSYNIEISDPCWGKAGETIVLKKSEERTVRLDAKQRLAALDVNATDADDNAIEADVAVDGKSYGKAPIKFKIPLCSKEVVVTYQGKSFRRSLTGALVEKQTMPIAAVLGDATATIEVKVRDENGAEVSGAEVKVDGALVGTTPGSYRVPVSSRDVLIEYGDKEYKTTVSLTPKAVVQVDGKLEAKYVPPPPKDEDEIEGLPYGTNALRVEAGRESPFMMTPAVPYPDYSAGTDNPPALALRARLDVDKRAVDDDFRAGVVGHADYNAYLGDLSNFSFLSYDAKLHLGIGELDETNWVITAATHRTDLLENPAVPWGALAGGWDWKLGLQQPLDDDGNLLIGGKVGYTSSTFNTRLNSKTQSDDGSGALAVALTCKQTGLCNPDAMLFNAWSSYDLNAFVRTALSDTLSVRGDFTLNSLDFDAGGVNLGTGPVPTWKSASIRRITGRAEYQASRTLGFDVTAGQVQITPSADVELAPKSGFVVRAIGRIRPISMLTLGGGYHRTLEPVGGVEKAAAGSGYSAEASIRLGSTLGVRASATWIDYAYENGRADNILRAVAEARLRLTEDLTITGGARFHRRQIAPLMTTGGTGQEIDLYSGSGYRFEQQSYFASAEYLF